jgi:CHASE2 domain-containing sensor protein
MDKGREVSTSSSAKRSQFWRTDWFVGVLVVVACCHAAPGHGLHRHAGAAFYDFASTSSARQPSDRVAVIAIDDQSIANIGRWPWPRDVHAKLIDQLAAAKAKTIVHTVFFFEPQVDRGLVFIRKMKSAGPRRRPRRGGVGEQLAR